MIVVQAEPFDPAAMLADFTTAASGAGAIVSFTGIVRGAHDGAAISRLWLDHHERMTDAAVGAIEQETRRRFDLAAIVIVHRVGSLHPGDPIVFIAAAAEHRRAAFDAVDYAMDRLKTDAPFWKRETRADGDHWIEARPSDHIDRARWEPARG